MPSVSAFHDIGNTLQVPPNARAEETWCSFDGQHRRALRPGDAVVIHCSRWPVPTVCSTNTSHDWFRAVREGLYWNLRKMQAGKGQ